MNVLLYHPHKESLEKIGFCLESQGELTLFTASDFQTAMDYFLEETSIDLVIASQNLETDKLFKFLLSTNANIPVILLREKDKEAVETYPDIRVLGVLDLQDAAEKLTPLISKHFSEILSSSMNQDYCRIKTSLLVRVVPLEGDLYIRLSSIKFVKIFRVGTTFSREDLEKYLVRKKVSFLYVKKDEAQEFVYKFKEDLANILVNAKPGDTDLLDTVTEAQELIQELSSRLGFTDEVRQLAKTNVDLAMKAIGSSPRLHNSLSSSQLSKRNFISSHSVVLAHIACSISALVKWPSNTTYQKLVMAALFHDFTFVNTEHAKIGTLKELEAQRIKVHLSDEECAFIRNHPIKFSESIKMLDEVPSDVDTIVLQHHERPDGSGFPRGLNSHQIAPLSAVFIVAHDILDSIFIEKNEFNMRSFLRKSESRYPGHTFRKLWVALNEAEAKKRIRQGSSRSSAA